jgi:hypothetical protein
VIVATAGNTTAETGRKVYIYDGDDPDLPMWMVIDSNDGEWYKTEFSSLAAVNGVIALGSGDSVQPVFETRNRLDLYYFVSDKIESSGSTTSGRYYGTVEGLVNRKIHATNRGDVVGNSVYPYVSIKVNDVAMTVLPNAPIDDDTGLPVPTIAVATDGGVSVIRDDGSVYDISGVAVKRVAFYNDNKSLLIREVGNACSYGAIPVSDNSWTSWREGYFNETTTFPCTLNQINTGLYSNGNYDLGIPSDFGLSLIRVNPSDQNISTGAYITSKYNTGWMPGDIKLATLSDTTVETNGVNSDELVNNGDFSEQFDEENDGWYNKPPSSGSTNPWIISGEVASHTGEASYLQQNNVFETGKQYALTFTVTGIVILPVGTGIGSTTQNITFGAGTHTYVGTAISGNLQFYSNTTTTIDNVSVRETTELITNGDFSAGDDGSWTTEIGWTISGQQAVANTSVSSTLYQTLTFEIGKTYVITMDVVECTSGSVSLRVADPSDPTSETYSYKTSPGTYSRVFTATAQSMVVGAIVDVNSNLVIDNISVRATTELVTNGDFSTDVNAVDFANTYPEWTAYNAAVSVTGGRLKVDDSGNAGDWSSAVQKIDTVIGKKYILSVEYFAETDDGIIGYCNGSYTTAGTALSSTNYIEQSSSGTYAIEFTATNSITSIFLGVNSKGISYFDNVSVRPAEEDRSVNGNGLQIIGAINKTPVAPGADLVAYSGFSASDYLVQPYNEDLDFGTGDFSIMGWAKTTSSANQKIFTRDLDMMNRFQVYINNGGVSVFTEEDDQFSYLEGSTDVNNGSWFNFYCIRRSGMLEVYVNGKKENAQASSDSTPRNVNFGEIPGYVGKHIHDTSNSFEGSIALLRISKTAPTADQIAKIYRDEKALFQDGAQATLYGTSDAVTALAYDDSNQLLHVGTASGRSDFRGLVRVNNTTTAISNSISAAEGTIIQN